LAHRCFELWQQERGALGSLLRSWVPIVVATTFLLILPMMIVYPLSQGDYQAALAEVYEERATPIYRPSSPQGGYLLRQRGYPLSTITADPGWWRLSYQSYYGYFGIWRQPASDLAYFGAAMLVLMATGFTYYDFMRRRAAYPSLMRLMLPVAPPFILAIFAASIYNSWAIDNQPQGRYLFFALLPLSLLVGGAVDDEPRWLVTLRALIWGLFLALSFYTIWEAAKALPTWGIT
jgi:hypothetical protein